MATILNLDKKGESDGLNRFFWSNCHSCTFIYVLDPLLETQQHEGAQGGHVHIRIQQRNGRKTLTTVQGLSDEYDKKKIVRVCKKVGVT